MPSVCFYCPDKCSFKVGNRENRWVPNLYVLGMVQHFLSGTSKSAGSCVVRHYCGGESLHYQEDQDYFPGGMLQDFRCGTVLGGGNCASMFQ
jgi:hypothetical protein